MGLDQELELWEQFGYERPHTVDRWINGELTDDDVDTIFALWKAMKLRKRGV